MRGQITAAGARRVLNWHPSLMRRMAQFAPNNVTRVPAVIDLRSKMPPITDQGELGSCTAHATVAPMWRALANAGKTPFTISTLFQYYVERILEGTVTSDAGATIADILRAAHHYGICPDYFWPYDISKFRELPPTTAFDKAKEERAHVYAPVPLTVKRVAGCLALGFPIMFGISVYESFENVQHDGKIPMPGSYEELLGGHAIDIVGINSSDKDSGGIPAQHVVIRNSWNVGWADKGYGYMPIAYVTDSSLASDAWMVRLM
jgi:C1A family cysteine protease